MLNLISDWAKKFMMNLLTAWKVPTSMCYTLSEANAFVLDSEGIISICSILESWGRISVRLLTQDTV